MPETNPVEQQTYAAPTNDSEIGHRSTIRPEKLDPRARRRAAWVLLALLLLLWAGILVSLVYY